MIGGSGSDVRSLQSLGTAVYCAIRACTPTNRACAFTCPVRIVIVKTPPSYSYVPLQLQKREEEDWRGRVRLVAMADGHVQHKKHQLRRESESSKFKLPTTEPQHCEEWLNHATVVDPSSKYATPNAICYSAYSTLTIDHFGDAGCLGDLRTCCATSRNAHSRRRLLALN
jgi:hypothetical protein